MFFGERLPLYEDFADLKSLVTKEDQRGFLWTKEGGIVGSWCAIADGASTRLVQESPTDLTACRTLRYGVVDVVVDATHFSMEHGGRQ